MNSKVKSVGELSKEAFKTLKKFQTGEKSLLKTGRDYIDSHIGGLIPSSLFLLGGSSGTGKTHEILNLCRGVLDENINPTAKNFTTLEFMLEMKFMDLVLRDATRITNKKKSEILSKEFNDDEKKLMREYNEALNDGRRFIVEESIDAEEFFSISDEFCENNKDKDAIIILLDHLLLITGKDSLEKLAMYTNILRKKYENVYFIYLSQLNRTAYDNIGEKSNAMIPSVANIYGSSHFEFLSSYVVVMINPFKMGVQEYMKFKRDRYNNLSDFMTDEDNKGFYSFNTLGNMFYHCLKLRDSDDIYNNLFIEKMNISSEQLNKMKIETTSNNENNFIIETPIFNSPLNSWKNENNFDNESPF